MWGWLYWTQEYYRATWTINTCSEAKPKNMCWSSDCYDSTLTFKTAILAPPNSYFIWLVHQPLQRVLKGEIVIWKDDECISDWKSMINKPGLKYLRTTATQQNSFSRGYAEAYLIHFAYEVELPCKTSPFSKLMVSVEYSILILYLLF